MFKSSAFMKRIKSKPSSTQMTAMNHEEKSRLTSFFAVLSKIDNDNKRLSKQKKTKDRLAKVGYDKRAHTTMGPIFLVMFNILTFIKTMIDTVVLLLSSDSYSITNPEQFVPSARWALQKTRYSLGLTSRQNPTKKELISGIYKPRLTLARRANVNGKLDTILKIELSLPKLLFGDNINELQLKDFKQVAVKLVTVLAAMGIAVTAEALSCAPITAIHYGKNIVLTDGSTPHFFISKIKEANLQNSLDANQTDYRNDGHSFKWHCKGYEVIFYDKLKEIAKTDPRKAAAIRSKARKKKFELLRMEVRLNRRQKMTHLFAKLGIKVTLTFKNLFKPSIAKKVLLHYLDAIESKRPLLLDYQAGDKELLVALIVHNPAMAPKQLLQMYGLQQALNVVNIRELRSMFVKTGQRSWLRLVNDVQKIKLPTTHNQFDNVREQLVTFKALKLRYRNF